MDTAPFQPTDFYAHSTVFFNLCFFGDDGRSIAHANTSTPAFTYSLRRNSDPYADRNAPAYANSMVSSHSQAQAVAFSKSHAGACRKPISFPNAKVFTL